MNTTANVINPPTNHRIANIWIGICWKVLSCAFFASTNAIVRYLTGGSSLYIQEPLPVYTIMFFQNLLGTCILLLIFSNTISVKQLFSTKHFILHFSRISTATLAIGLWYLSFRYMALTEVVALSFIAPMFTIIGAVIFLKEPLTWQRIATLALSSIGGFFMTRPDLKLQVLTISWIVILPLIANLIFAFDKLLTRKLIFMGESPNSLTFFLIAFMTPFSLLPCLYYGWTTPSSYHWPWLILLGCLGVGAHFSFSKAYKYADVTSLLPFGMSKIILCGLIGYFAFGEYPQSLNIWLGVMTLTGCTILLRYRPK